MLSNEYFKKGGESVTVGICDTGLKTDLFCFKNTEIQYKTFGRTGERHGTHIASTMLQIAPKVKLVFAGGIMDSYAKLQDMLEWIKGVKVDVLNLSLAFPERDLGVSKVLHKIADVGTMIICAKSKEYPFPWSEDCVISAGEGGDFEALNEWTATSSDGYRTVMRGSSVAAALTSGLCALCRATHPDLTKEKFLQMISVNDIKVPPKPKRQRNLQL